MDSAGRPALETEFSHATSQQQSARVLLLSETQQAIRACVESGSNRDLVSNSADMREQEGGNYYIDTCYVGDGTHRDRVEHSGVRREFANSRRG